MQKTKMCFKKKIRTNNVAEHEDDGEEIRIIQENGIEINKLSTSKPVCLSTDQQLEIDRLQNEVRQLCIERDLARLERDSLKRQLDELKLKREVQKKQLEDENAVTACKSKFYIVHSKHIF